MMLTTVSVFTSSVPCAFLFPLNPHCGFDSFPIVSFYPKLFLPIQASLFLDYFPGLVCNERHLISKESLGWILKWVFEADCCSVEGNPDRAPGLWGVEMGNTGYAGTRSRWEQKFWVTGWQSINEKPIQTSQSFYLWALHKRMVMRKTLWGWKGE